MQNFNSHAHVERDLKRIRFSIIAKISTHTLTWSVTNDEGAITDTPLISTHTLTWSVTATNFWECDFNEISTHTLTWSVT